MLIKSSNKLIPLYALIFSIIIALIITILFANSYIDYSKNNDNALNFFSWYYSTFLHTMDVYCMVFFLLCPLLVYGVPVYIFILRYIVIKRLKKKNHLLSINLLPDRIYFNYNYPQSNFYCTFDQIDELNVKMHTICIKSQAAVDKITINFIFSDGKEYKLSVITMNILKFMYLLIDNSRNIKKFKYSFTGYGEVEIIKEKLDEYIKCGFKQHLSTSQEIMCKFFSLTFPPMIYFLVQDLYNNHAIKNEITVFWFFLGAVFLTLFFDILLIWEKLKEKEYGIPNKDKTFWRYITGEILISIKIIIIVFWVSTLN